MIRQPLTTITINNDPTANALKSGTQQLIKGTKIARAAYKKYGAETGIGFGKHAKKAIAESIRTGKSIHGSKVIRQGYKDLGSKVIASSRAGNIIKGYR